MDGAPSHLDLCQGSNQDLTKYWAQPRNRKLAEEVLGEARVDKYNLGVSTLLQKMLPTMLYVLL